MYIEVMKSKIHRATVTQADLNYIGSITIDEDLMDAVNIIENEKVDIYDVTNGNRLHTYAIKGKRGSGIIGINGAAAHLVKECDCIEGDKFNCHLLYNATVLYNAGYRKQSDVAMEIFDEIKAMPKKFTEKSQDFEFGYRTGIQEMLAELKKKYTEESENDR